MFCCGQSTLNFPRIIPPGEFRTMGFAVVNPGSTIAGVTFNLYGSDGTLQRSSVQSIAARGQFAKLAVELFGEPDTSGWVQATSPTLGLQGFWLGGDFNTFGDGAEAATSSSELIVPLITFGSEVDIANTGTAGVTVLIDLLGEEGFDLDMPYPTLIPAKGFFKTDIVSLSSFFPHLDDFSLPSHMRITCRCGNAALAATMIAHDFIGVSPSWVVVNGLPSSTPTLSITFPHVVQGPQGTANWTGVLGITNLSNSTNNISIAFMSESGTPVQTFQRQISPYGAIRGGIRDYGLTPSFQNGWLRITSTNAMPLTGYLAYADTLNRGVAVVLPQQEAQSALLFAHIADLPPWLTGVALLNSNAASANVTVSALNPEGSLIGRATFPLQPGAKISKLLSELIPQTQNRSSDGGFIFVQSNLPLFGMELFFSRNLSLLSNVAAGRIVPGITYVPPNQ
jgi:hypothetical protein